MKLTEIPYMYLSVSSLCWLSQQRQCVGGKQRERGGDDKPPVRVDQIELPGSCVEGLVAMRATVFVWGGQEEGEQGVVHHHLH